MTSTALIALKHRLLGLQTQLRFLRFARALKFNPDQPRDEYGRWIATGGESDEDDKPPIVLAARRRDKVREAACEEQLERDIFHCRMVGLPSCYAQAHFRYSACLRGDPIPPLSY